MCISASLKTFEKSTPLRAGGVQSFRGFVFSFSFLSIRNYGNSIRNLVEKEMRLIGIPRKMRCEEELNAKKRDDKCNRFVRTNVRGESRNWAGNATLVFYGKFSYPSFHFFLPNTFVSW